MSSTQSPSSIWVVNGWLVPLGYCLWFKLRDGFCVKTSGYPRPLLSNPGFFRNPPVGNPGYPGRREGDTDHTSENATYRLASEATAAYTPATSTHGLQRRFSHVSKHASTGSTGSTGQRMPPRIGRCAWICSYSYTSLILTGPPPGPLTSARSSYPRSFALHLR
jgi:hypothetical protein